MAQLDRARISDNLTVHSEHVADELVARYLALLRVPRRSPSTAALKELVAAHVTRIPFENISKLYNRKHLGLTDLTPVETFLEGIERYHFGGTCYACNFHFYRLLTSLGYHARLCGADMRNPDVHVVSMVESEGREYLLDTGYGAPFLAPLPRDLKTDYTIILGRDRYVLKPQDSQGRSRLELHRDGAPKHGYLVKPAPRQIEDFNPAIAASFHPSATFLNAVLLARFWPGRSVVIHNLTLMESSGLETKAHPLAGRDDLPAAVEAHFEIPGNIVAQAIADLPQLQDAWA